MILRKISLRNIARAERWSTSARNLPSNSLLSEHFTVDSFRHVATFVSRLSRYYCLHFTDMRINFLDQCMIIYERERPVCKKRSI